MYIRRNSTLYVLLSILLIIRAQAEFRAQEEHVKFTILFKMIDLNISLLVSWLLLALFW